MEQNIKWEHGGVVQVPDWQDQVRFVVSHKGM